MATTIITIAVVFILSITVGSLWVWGDRGYAKLESEPVPKDPCTVPDCDNPSKIHLEEFGWHFCKEHGKWFFDRFKEIERDFPEAIAYIDNYDNWRFYAELENYPEGCYDNLQFFEVTRSPVGEVLKKHGFEPTVAEVKKITRLINRASEDRREGIFNAKNRMLFIYFLLYAKDGTPDSKAINEAVANNTKSIDELLAVYYVRKGSSAHRTVPSYSDVLKELPK